MTATNPETTPNAPVPTAPATPAAAPAQDSTDWKAEARKWEKLAKDNSNAAKRIAELEEAGKTELQKAMDRATAAEQRAAEFELKEQRSQWAANIVKGSAVPADALRGDTEDDLKAHFAQLKALITPPTPQETPKGLIGPYVPSDGKTPGQAALTPAQEFADWLTAAQGKG